MSSLAPSPSLVCPRCGQAHRLPPLRPGETARCGRCDTTLLRGAWLGPEGALAFTLAGLIFAVPAVTTPLVEVSKWQAANASFAFSGVRALWEAGMHLLALWVFLCGLLVPLLLLGTLAGVLLPPRLGWSAGAPSALLRLARALERWSMPEVHVLAVLVAFGKLGSLVHVQPGPGLWSYAAMAGCTLAAWRSFELCHAPRVLSGKQRGALEAA